VTGQTNENNAKSEEPRQRLRSVFSVFSVVNLASRNPPKPRHNSSAYGGRGRGPIPDAKEPVA